jgi:hypothetical protein
MELLGSASLWQGTDCETKDSYLAGPIFLFSPPRLGIIQPHIQRVWKVGNLHVPCTDSRNWSFENWELLSHWKVGWRSSESFTQSKWHFYQNIVRGAIFVEFHPIYRCGRETGDYKTKINTNTVFKYNVSINYGFIIARFSAAPCTTQIQNLLLACLLACSINNFKANKWKHKKEIRLTWSLLFPYFTFSSCPFVFLFALWTFPVALDCCGSLPRRWRRQQIYCGAARRRPAPSDICKSHALALTASCPCSEAVQVGVAVAIWTFISRVTGSNFVRVTFYHCISSVCPGECRDSIFKYAAVASFHILTHLPSSALLIREMPASDLGLLITSRQRLFVVFVTFLGQMPV